MARRFFTACLFACLALPASATTIDFSRLDTQDWGAQSNLTGLTIEGATEEGGVVQTGTASVGHRRFGALGVKSEGDAGYSDGSDQLDTQGANDVVVLRFDRAVRLERISFSATNFTDRFDLYLGEGLTHEQTMKADDLSGHDWVSTILLGSGYEGTTFAIGASEYQSCGYSIQHGHDCWTEHSAFRISGITFSEIDLNPIPAPAAFWLLLSAILGLIWRKRAHSAQFGDNLLGLHGHKH